MPQSTAIMVGTAMIAAQAEMRPTSSFWRTLDWVRFAVSALVTTKGYG